MPPLILFGLIAIVLWTLVARRFTQWGVAGPAVLLVLGAVTVIWDVDAFGIALDSPMSEKIVEVILALLLFADATEVKGGMFGKEGRVIARLVLIALPLSLLLAGISAGLLLPGVDLFVIAVIACVAMPTDFSPAAELLRDRRIPVRLRQIVNVESGYNDGLISPLFGMALAIAVLSTSQSSDWSDAEFEQQIAAFLISFFNAVPATAMAIAVGAALGAGVGTLVRAMRARGFADAMGARYVMLLLPLVAYGVATLPALSANGFVAAFAAGIFYRLTRMRGNGEGQIVHEEFILLEEVGALTANFVWFVLGGATVVVIVSGVGWGFLVFALLALTVVRMAPVYLSLMGSSVPRRGRVVIGALGPRGTASVVFGLLAYNALPEEDGLVVLAVMVILVVGSILLHGIVGPLLLRRVRETARAE